MKYLLSLIAVLLIVCCNDASKEIKDNNKVGLRADTVNVVKLTDTLVIFENTCRGCAFEESTRFEISDTLNVVRLHDVITKDNNKPDVEGGSISKNLLLVPLKTGVTTIRLYKFWSGKPTAQDSALYTNYSIDVRN